mgnify:FL=1
MFPPQRQALSLSSYPFRSSFSSFSSARFSMRIRYRQPLQGGVLHVTEQGGYIVFDRPQRGVTAGQFAAWYDGDELVGSGVIHR